LPTRKNIGNYWLPAIDKPRS